MRTIDLSKVRDSLPEGATVELKHKKGEGAFFDVVLVGIAWKVRECCGAKYGVSDK